jgi:hypothetical protein
LKGQVALPKIENQTSSDRVTPAAARHTKTASGYHRKR